MGVRWGGPWLGTWSGDSRQAEVRLASHMMGWWGLADGSGGAGGVWPERCDQRLHSRGSNLDLPQHRERRNGELKYTTSTPLFLVIKKTQFDCYLEQQQHLDPCRSLGISQWITKLSLAQINQFYELYPSTSKTFHLLWKIGCAFTSQHCSWSHAKPRGRLEPLH